jgi:hypothetical protein
MSVSNKCLNRITPAEAGVQEETENLDSGFRRNDVEKPHRPIWTRSMSWGDVE